MEALKVAVPLCTGDTLKKKERKMFQYVNHCLSKTVFKHTATLKKTVNGVNYLSTHFFLYSQAHFNVQKSYIMILNHNRITCFPCLNEMCHLVILQQHISSMHLNNGEKSCCVNCALKQYNATEGRIYIMGYIHGLGYCTQNITHK